MTVVRRRMRRQSLKDFLGALYTQQRRFSLEKVRHFQQLRNRRQVMCKLNQICLFLWLTVAIIADMPIKKRKKKQKARNLKPYSNRLGATLQFGCR